MLMVVLYATRKQARSTFCGSEFADNVATLLDDDLDTDCLENEHLLN